MTARKPTYFRVRSSLRNPLRTRWDRGNKPYDGKRLKSKSNRELTALKEQLQDITDRALSGELDTKRAAVAAQVLNVKVRAIELSRRAREQDELAHRLDEVEDLLEEAERRTHARW